MKGPGSLASVASRLPVTTRREGGIRNIHFRLDLAQQMIPITRDAHPANSSRNNRVRIGAQPIALTAAALCLVLAGAASIALWRVHTGNSPETDRAVAARQLQARAAQASEQLVEKTKGLEVTQQESIDQLQVVQDQLSTVRRLLASQQADTKRLSEQVSGLTEAIDGLRQSYASAQPSEPTPAPATRNRSVRVRAYHRTVRTVQKRAKHS